MAIITDATGRQLAQAVGGIDTGGLAKDTTLQATNTALGNMNSTQQSIASAINGLGQMLGSDKANIDGSNIANPSAFRQAIGVNEIKSINFTGTTDSAGNLLIPTITISNATPLVVITSNGYPAGFIFSGRNYYAKLIANGMTQLANTTVSAYVFYI